MVLSKKYRVWFSPVARFPFCLQCKQLQLKHNEKDFDHYKFNHLIQHLFRIEQDPWVYLWELLLLKDTCRHSFMNYNYFLLKIFEATLILTEESNWVIIHEGIAKSVYTDHKRWYFSLITLKHNKETFTSGVKCTKMRRNRINKIN